MNTSNGYYTSSLLVQQDYLAFDKWLSTAALTFDTEACQNIQRKSDQITFHLAVPLFLNLSIYLPSC